MVDAFFLEDPKEQPTKCLSRGFRRWESRRKRLYFHRAVEMKQSHKWQNLFLQRERHCHNKWLPFFWRLCHNGWCFISWNSKEITNKIPPITEPTSGKFWKKHIFSIYCWNKKNNRVLWQSLSEKPKRQPIKRLTHKVAYRRLKNEKLKKSA